MRRAEVRARLFQSLFSSILNFRVLFAFVLCVFLLCSAYLVVLVKFKHKQLLDQQQKQMVAREKLNDQWTQILLEYSTLASPGNVEDYAKAHDMHLPEAGEIKTLELVS
ncbi:MAG: cell division protein FtsL [Francisellaceae bacterium]